MFGGQENNFSLFLESHALSVLEERADAFLNAFKMPFPNSCLTTATVGDMEHVTEGNLMAGAVHNRQEVAVHNLVVGNNPVTLCDPHARHFTANLALMDDLFRLPFPSSKHHKTDICLRLG
jgi:hypothetical protein